MRRYRTKIYLYDSSQENNNYRGEDYSKYILQNDTLIDNLDDTLDSAELTLVGLPFRENFSPKTKFILEKWQNVANEGEEDNFVLWKDFHLLVDNDAVTQPILSDNNYFDHHISFLEAGVDSQGRLVDNMAVTYKLKDISLDRETTYSPDASALRDTINVDYEEEVEYGYNVNTSRGVTTEEYNIGHKFIWIMPDWYQVNLGQGNVTPSWDYWKNLKLNQILQGTETQREIRLPMPLLECLGVVRKGTGFIHLGYCSLEYYVEEIDTNGEKRNIVSGTVNPSRFYQRERWTQEEYSGYSKLNDGWIVSRKFFEKSTTSTEKSILNISLSKVADMEDNVLNRVLTFVVKKNCKYNIVIKRKVFNNTDWTGSGAGGYITRGLVDKYPARYSRGYRKYEYAYTYEISNSLMTIHSLNDSYPLVSGYLVAFQEGDVSNIYFTSAPETTAYYLYKKALLSTQNTAKVDGTPIDETINSYYLEDIDLQELKNTQIIENFYIQKNWWEIQMEIGKYIHARPLIRFGSDDRFVTKWKRYGVIEQSFDSGTKMSVYNSQFVAEYISACSSYVTNMVQLGGSITETVAPKSSSEDYMVYNDVAEIKVSKDIIELLKVEVRKTESGGGTIENNWLDMTEYVFEENIYQLLSVDANDNINKGYALYYTLGTNVIKGLNYKLPSVHAGDTDYAIKNILGRLFSIDKDKIRSIKVNDYLFRIKYRIKDSLRSNQARPDLRKYLLSSKYDNVPQHNQFNNQTDTVVDSVKFGNNVYGKLIRTGNMVVTDIEYNTDLNGLKNAGELYRIDAFDNLYYVSKVKHTFYTDHIVSEVEYSKDFNRLSEIIGIPSEPRFYEIAERNIVDREFSISDYIMIGDYKTDTPIGVYDRGNLTTYIRNWNFLINMIFTGTATYPKFAVTKFKNDIDRIEANKVIGNESFESTVCVPTSTYCCGNTLTIEWDMVDNFSAGDQIEEVANPTGTPVDSAYNILKPYKYTDVYGRADLVDFAIYQNIPNLTAEQVKNLPESPITPYENINELLFSNNVGDISRKGAFGKIDNGIGLLKDSREAIKFNYNLIALTDSDRYVLSSYFWQENKGQLTVKLLSEEINKLSVDTIPNNIILDYSCDVFPIGSLKINTNIGGKIELMFIPEIDLTDDEMDKVKAVAICGPQKINNDENAGATYFVMGKNVGDLPNDEKLRGWDIFPYYKSIFKKQ